MLCHFNDNNSTLQQLDRNLHSTITLLCFRLASCHISSIKILERHSFWMDFIISRRASDILGGTSESTLYPHTKDKKWRTLMFQLLSHSNVGRPEVETENLFKREYPVPRAGELIALPVVRTKESSDLLEGRVPVTSSTPTQLPLLLQLYSSKRKSGDFHSLSTFGTESWTNFSSSV